MDVTPKTLQSFRESLAERGLGERTQDVYAYVVGACARHPKGMAARLTDGDLSPKYLRLNRAALLAWATFSEDASLLLKVKRIRLPAAERQKAKVPFRTADWKKMVHAVRDEESLSPAMRAALFLVIVRGLRASDALRIKRTDVQAALRTGRLSFEAKGRKRIEYDAKPIREALEMLMAEKPYWTRVSDLIVTWRCKTDGTKRVIAAYKRLDREIRAMGEAAGVDGVHAHRFRRTYATAFLLHPKLKADPQAMFRLQHHMGWAKVETAMQYVYAVSRAENDAVGNDLLQEIVG